VVQRGIRAPQHSAEARCARLFPPGKLLACDLPIQRMRVLVVGESPEEAQRLRDELRRAGYADIVVIESASPRREVLEHLVDELQALRAQLAAANLRLAERKLVERAKGLLMKSRGLDEAAAYALMRKLAMDRKLRLGEVAQQLIEAAGLLNGA
jgi:response regulator NasT